MANVKVRKMPSLALKCTFLGQKKLNVCEKERKTSLFSYCTWYKSLYAGYVHQIEDSAIIVGFSKRLRDKFVANMQFNIRFTFNRFPNRNMHRHSDPKINNPIRKISHFWAPKLKVFETFLSIPNQIWKVSNDILWNFWAFVINVSQDNFGDFQLKFGILIKNIFVLHF